MQAGIPAWLNLILGLGGLGTLVSGLALWWKHRRDADLAEKRDGRDSVKDDIEVFASWMAAARESAKEAHEARQEASKVRDDLNSLRMDIDALLARVAALESDQGHLIGYVTVIIAGVEEGTVPPLPPMPPSVAKLLTHHTKEKP